MDEIDPNSVKNLIDAALVETDERTLSEIILKLQSTGTLEVFDAAYELCVDQDAHKKIVGFRILGELGKFEIAFPKETLELTLHLVKTESDPKVLSAMARVLARAGGPRAIQTLEKLKEDPNAQIRYGVMLALAYFLRKEDRQMFFRLYWHRSIVNAHVKMTH